MIDLIIALVVLVIVGSALFYIRKQKKKGVKCIGCPAGENCASGGCSSCNGLCHSSEKEEL